jgi:hypothetical protein
LHLRDIGGVRIAAVLLVSLPGLLMVRPPAVRADVLAVAPADSIANPAKPDSIPVRYVFPTVEVTGSYEGSLTPRSAASQGLVTPRELALRPMQRAGDILETIPGLLISQHSGEGKANQYYLRGFNLDHGTDFATTVAGIPVNMPTNAHGQGYTDINYVIPELVSGIQFRKGTYSVEDGDFSSAGSAFISYRDTLSGPIGSLSAGQDGYVRLLAAASPRLSSGSVLGAIELLHNDGPWVHPDDFRKINALARYSRGTPENGFSVTAMGYDGRWNSTDQVPERAVAAGEVDRFGSIDPTDGGTTSRYSLSGEFLKTSPNSLTKVSAYVISYRLDLFSNFTYFLNDTLRGDQFEQADERVVTGLRVSHGWGAPGERQTVGIDFRHDNIVRVGLYHTEAQRRLSTIREDGIIEWSLSPFWQLDRQWSSRMRTLLGIRGDAYRYGVASSYAPYSGSDITGIASPKASLILGPWGPLDLYVNAGYGFHSTDARGARFTSTPVPPATQQSPVAFHFPVPGGPPIELSALLVRTKGAEIGARIHGSPRWSATTSIWGLDIASETVFLGDAGLGAPSRPSRRTGIELAGEGSPSSRVHLDADVAYSRARFRDDDPAGSYIPGAVEGVVSSGVSYEHPRGGYGELHVRYFGPRPLIEDNSVRSPASTVLSAQVGYRTHHRWTIELEVFNLLDSAVSDIDYYYTSRLRNEPVAGVDDIHSHPQAPRTLRLEVSTGLPH